MSGVEGGRPSSFSGGFKGGILFEKRIPSLVPRRARRSPSRASAGKRMQRCRAAIESPAPYGRKKGAALSGCITPRALWARKKPRLRAAIKKGASKEAPFSVASAIISKEVIEEIPGIGVVAVAAIAVPAVAVTAVTIVAVVGALVGIVRFRRFGNSVGREDFD